MDEPRFGGGGGGGQITENPPNDLWDISDDEDGRTSQQSSTLSNKHQRLLTAKGLLKVPDPVVYKNDCAVKAMLVMEDVVIIATDNGEVKVIDKFTFKLLCAEKVSDDPILKIEQVLYAVLVQLKDVQGTICLLKIWKAANGKYQIKKMSEIQTMNQSFTTFGSTVLCSYSHKTGEFLADHITVITPCHEEPHHPRVWVLNNTADSIMVDQTIDLYLKSNDKAQEEQPEPKKDTKKKKKKKAEESK